MSKPRWLGLVLLLGVVLQIVACGGSGGDSTPQTTPIKFAIAWPERSRAIQAPTSALSATLIVNEASSTGQDVVQTVNRNASPTAYTQVYTTTTPGRTGTFSMTLRFFDQPGGAGNVVAVAASTVTIAADGSGIPDLSVVNRITTVTIPQDQMVLVGEETQLTFTARDSQSGIVAVTPGSAHWEIVGTTEALTLTDDGRATGQAAGTAQVRVRVDGVTSDPVAVTVLGPPDFADPSFETLPLNPGQWKRNVEVTGIPWSGEENWGVANGVSSWGTTGSNGTSQYAFIQVLPGGQSHGALIQTISGLSIGQDYRVTLWIARRNGNVGGNVGVPITVTANGTEILGPTSPSGDGTYQQVETQTFTATQGTYEFKIQTVLPQNPQDMATLVDDVHLERVD
jgi:hypothetical protein